MYLIAGLGNPGRKYERTKHNVGFDVIDYVTDRHRIPFSGIQFQAECGKGIIAGQKVMLAEPLTYMNLSGEAVAALVNYYKLDPEEELIVIYDDISLDPGQIRVRKKGSAGGHNGIKNIIACLGTDKFKRIRVGIGAKPDRWDLADYVLAPFTPENREKIEDAIKDAADALELILSGDMDEAMNRYNHKASREPKE
ncbi:MAG TPA: aminoacyl-tRNA hydrolase [Candidatus Scatomonas merdigallinarum]|nr:aminoacyl-tRNA hydrolase [Candidatus Scatomonas merdigallinarum]